MKKHIEENSLTIHAHGISWICNLNTECHYFMGYINIFSVRKGRTGMNEDSEKDLILETGAGIFLLQLSNEERRDKVLSKLTCVLRDNLN